MAGAKFVVETNCKYNDKKVSTNLPLGDVRCNFTLLAADNVSTAPPLYVTIPVDHIVKARQYDHNVTCNTVKDSKKKKELAVIHCRVSMTASQITKVTMNLMEICDDATPSLTKDATYSSSCTTDD
ncbi:hypothetical protein PENTCL1PPCAC_23965, partial [Pristionchus entomophagus]